MNAKKIRHVCKILVSKKLFHKKDKINKGNALTPIIISTNS